MNFTDFICTSLVVLAIATVVLTKNCDKLGIVLYEDLGCIPYYDQFKDCPVRYKCRGLEPWYNECHFRGNIYNDHQIVDDERSSPACDRSCFCESYGKKSHFMCAILDCPEWTEESQVPGCYRKYSLDQCCPVGQICPPFVDVAKCVVDGVEYKEGEHFYPKNSCLNCICQEGFTGKLETPFCKRRTCGEQLTNGFYLQNACAPVYRKKSKDEVICCPEEWICYDGTEVIQGRPKSGDRCSFGSTVLKIGQMFKKFDPSTKSKVVCECKIPPLLTCSKLEK